MHDGSVSVRMMMGMPSSTLDVNGDPYKGNCDHIWDKKLDIPSVNGSFHTGMRICTKCDARQCFSEGGY